MSAVCGCHQMFANRRNDELDIAFMKAIRCTQVIPSSASVESGLNMARNIYRRRLYKGSSAVS